MPSVTVSSKTEQSAKQFQKAHAPGKVSKKFELKSAGEAVDFLVDYAQRRMKALKKWAIKPKAKKAKAKSKAKAKAKAKATKAPKTGLAGKLSKSKKALKAPALKGNRRRPAPPPEQPSAPPAEAQAPTGSDDPADTLPGQEPTSGAPPTPEA